MPRPINTHTGIGLVQTKIIGETRDVSSRVSPEKGRGARKRGRGGVRIDPAPRRAARKSATENRPIVRSVLQIVYRTRRLHPRNSFRG
ncbi:MAG: hypothetical protein HSCHL_0478 [Hydrogenibacillus schlegelii]|uniref:Uncharacterized protein n=1 Tax=Hydrogenibacillus schlegelii TaxID=1484 RepID=A0A2T5GDD6_HYDSH|nr:MAG: hypothetical protein HSCHL_0478 [Hydrogenibacillus schlegelii]